MNEKIVRFAKVAIAAMLIISFETPSVAATIISQGTYSEDANSDNAPQSKNSTAGNIKKLSILQKSDGTLNLVIDYWSLPNSRYHLQVQWCTYLDEFRHNIWTGENLTFLCDPSDPNWRNYQVFFEPALNIKGSQIGLRKTFIGSSKKGNSKNQRIYTIKGDLFKRSAVAGVRVATYYSSDTLERISTTCSGSYAITCSTSSSSIFDVDEVLLEMNTNYLPETPVSKPTGTTSPTPKTTVQNPPISATKTIQDYFDRIQGQFNPSTRKFQVECINDAPRDGSVDQLRVLLPISSDSFNLSGGREWFPTQFTETYKDKIKTWTQTTPTFLYIELDFTAKNSNPCGLIVNNIPRLSEIGSDVNYAAILVAGSTGFAITGKPLSKRDLGG